MFIYYVYLLCLCIMFMYYVYVLCLCIMFIYEAVLMSIIIPLIPCVLRWIRTKLNKDKKKNKIE